MTKAAETAPALKKEKEHTTVDFRFPKENKVQPTGFEDMTISEDITVTVKGRVTSIRQNEDEWDNGKNFSLNITSCRIAVPVKEVSLSEAIEDGKAIVD